MQSVDNVQHIINTLSPAMIESVRAVNAAEGKSACIKHLRGYISTGNGIHDAMRVYDRLTEQGII